ncbi:MAG: cell envelope biogenesis protein TolA [Sphingobium sp.]|nr:cell envelope biogenesis protein TolA [Sphingobium sp.]
MDRSDQIGLGAALLLHIGLVGALSVSLLSRRTPAPPPPPSVDVSLVEDIGLQSSAPKPVAEPAPSQAPDPGPPEDAAPPPPQPQKAAPEPPSPKPPEPKPAPVAAAKPAPPKPRDVATAAPAKPNKPAAKPVTAPTTPTKPAAKPGTGTQVAATKPKPRGSRLSDDIVAGLTDKPSPSRVVAPVGVVIDAKALAGIQDAIRRQIQPCADRLSNAGIPQEAKRIVIKFNLRLNRDGNLATKPTVLSRLNTDSETERYAQQIADLGIAAFRQCAPLKLPAEYYQTANGGWSNINYNWQLR